MSAVPRTRPAAEVGAGPQTGAHAGPGGSHARPAAALAYLSDAAAAVAAVRTASDLGVLALLDSAPAHTADVAEQLGLSPRETCLLLEALTGLGLLSVPEGYVRTVARSARAAAATHMWDALPETVRTGLGPHHVDTAAGSEALYGDVVGLLSDLTDPLVDIAAKHLVAQGLTHRALEVGSGAAPWSRVVARRDEGIEVTALDLPQIIEVTRRHVRADGLEGQYSYVPGDAFTLELDHAAYDLVLVPNVCHLFDPPANRALLRRLAPSLRPGGRMAIIDMLPGQTPELARSVGLYALGADDPHGHRRGLRRGRAQGLARGSRSGWGSALGRGAGGSGRGGHRPGVTSGSRALTPKAQWGRTPLWQQRSRGNF